MGFEGGYLSTGVDDPCGWTHTGGGLGNDHFGMVWAANVGNSLSQPAFQDAYGIAILTGNNQYRVRAWMFIQTGAPSVTFTLSGTGFSVTATIAPVGPSAQFAEADFSGLTPLAIPADAVLTVAI